MILLEAARSRIIRHFPLLFRLDGVPALCILKWPGPTEATNRSTEAVVAFLIGSRAKLDNSSDVSFALCFPAHLGLLDMRMHFANAAARNPTAF